MRTHVLIFATASLVLLSACSTGGTPPSEPADPADAPTAESPCVVGIWQLDVADYAAQSEAFVLGLGLPITEFGMTGAGTITFTADGLVATDISLTTTGTIVAGDTTVPLNQLSAYTGSGDWSLGSDAETLDLANWANVPSPDAPASPDAPLPTIDYTDIPTVAAECSASDLVLQGPDAPFAALWHR